MSPRPRSSILRAEKHRTPPQHETPRKTSTIGWRLMFVPYGADQVKVLDTHLLPTAEDGQRLAATYNALEWETHLALGADALIALGRRGAFVLEPVTR